MKNKLFLLISIFALITLLGTAATCNMCGVNLSNETTTTAATETNDTIGQASDTEETAKETIAQEITQTSDTTKTSSTNSTSTAPTIELKIIDGPFYSQSDKLCYYTIEAIVTGSPTPEVEFSRDDSNGKKGAYKVDIGLKIGEAYTLTAKAKNSSGEKSVTLDLKPDFIDRNLHPNIFGTVGPAGYVEKDVLKIGDSIYNSDWRGRFAFDLSDLKDKQITFAVLILENYDDIGTPCNFKGDIVIFYNDFLPDLTADDYYSVGYENAGTFPCNTDTLQVFSDLLLDKVYERANSNTELQFGIGYTNAVSNMDNKFDGREYFSATLRVAYIE